MRKPGFKNDGAPDTINFMARYGRGLICLAMDSQQIERLRLPLMAQQNGTRHQTAFTVSIEARTGVTTGISTTTSAKFHTPRPTERSLPAGRAGSRNTRTVMRSA